MSTRSGPVRPEENGAPVVLSGNEAIARGAYEAGVVVIAGYPGTPSTEIIENAVKYPELYAEWSPNEKVALEVAAGAAFRGARAMTTMKHVGLNVAADPLLTVAYTGVNAGLLVVVADDPGMWSSQNEQDSRHYARLAKIPVLEPSDSQEAKDMVGLGLKLSEIFDTPVLLRTTTRIAHSRSLVRLGERQAPPEKALERKIDKYVMVPAHARRRHPLVEDRLVRLGELADQVISTDGLAAGKDRQPPSLTPSSTTSSALEKGVWADFSGLNRLEWGDLDLGIITSGIAYQHVREVFPTATVLKLGLTYPLPVRAIRELARRVKRLYVVEELDPFLETEIRALGIAVQGKEIWPRIGELTPDIVAAGLANFTSEKAQDQRNRPRAKRKPNPGKKLPCAPRYCVPGVRIAVFSITSGGRRRW